MVDLFTMLQGWSLHEATSKSAWQMWILKNHGLFKKIIPKISNFIFPQAFWNFLTVLVPETSASLLGRFTLTPLRQGMGGCVHAHISILLLLVVFIYYLDGQRTEGLKFDVWSIVPYIFHVHPIMNRALILYPYFSHVKVLCTKLWRNSTCFNNTHTLHKDDTQTQEAFHIAGGGSAMAY